MNYVYFIQAVDGGPIKVGLSGNPTTRLQGLQSATASELEILVTIPGNRHIESLLHRELAEGRLRGEWFSEDTPGLAELIEALLAPDMTNEKHVQLKELLDDLDPERRVAA